MCYKDIKYFIAVTISKAHIFIAPASSPRRFHVDEKSSIAQKTQKEPHFIWWQ